MKLKGKFETDVIDDDIILVSMDNATLQGFLRANKTAAFIIRCIEQDSSENEIVRKIVEEFHTTEDKARLGLSIVIEKLKIHGLIDG